MAEGFTITLPSGDTRVGTVWFPPLTLITYSAAAGSLSMSTSVISIPSRASWALSRLQNAHHWVVYMVSGADTCCLLHPCETPVPAVATPNHVQPFPCRPPALR